MKKKAITLNAIAKIFHFYLPLIAGFILMVGPVFWTLICSFRTNSDLLQLPVKYIPTPFTFENYPYAWVNAKFSSYFLNSIAVSGVTSIVVLILTTFCAYALSRYNFPGKRIVTLMLLATQFIPTLMLLTPLFEIFKSLGLISTLTGLIVLFVAFQLPFNAILMISFVDAVPLSIEDAAKIDGCNLIELIIRVVFPILVPGFIAVTSFAFIMSWNEYLFPVIFVNDPNKFTISVGLGYMIGAYGRKFGALAAGSIISLIVPVMLFAFIQKYLVVGITAGAVKE